MELFFLSELGKPGKLGSFSGPGAAKAFWAT